MKSVVILGGGTAGWLTALFLQKNFKNLKISVVENPKQLPIIAGESGNTTFVDLIKSLDISLDEFIKETNATPKLGGKFDDWSGIGSTFTHCLITDHSPWLNSWNKITGEKSTEEAEKSKYLKFLIHQNIPIRKALYSNYLIEQNKVPFGSNTNLPCHPMWHFESRGAARYFKNLGILRGIELIEGVFSQANLSSKNISSIKLEDERVISADWFFDCSGFSRLLLGKTFSEPIIDFTKYFPARAVVAWWSDPEYSVTTNATAMKYGWSWNINLRHRSGNGYIYDPDHISLDLAISEAENRFNCKIDPVANFTYTPGIMKRSWISNSIAIGLSNGFLEPLEANGVAVIVESLYAIQDLWDPNSVSQSKVDRFNIRMWQIYNDIKDFLSLHYRGKRNDSDFWKDQIYNKNRVPETLQEKLDSWELYFKGDYAEPRYNGYSSAAWLQVLQGLQIFNYTGNLSKTMVDQGKSVINMDGERFTELVAPFWSIEDWIKKTA